MIHYIKFHGHNLFDIKFVFLCNYFRPNLFLNLIFFLLNAAPGGIALLGHNVKVSLLLCYLIAHKAYEFMYLILNDIPIKSVIGSNEAL